MPTKKVVIHYRRLVDRNFQDVDFQAAFDAGLASSPGGQSLSAADANRITTSGDGHRMCLLSPTSAAHYCLGEIAVFRDGDVPIAETDPAGQVTLRTIPLNGNEEAIRGTTYFMSRGPHVALLHHDSSSRFLEDYLRWLMRQPLGNLPADEILSLQPLVSVGGVPVTVRGVRSLKIRAEVERIPGHLASSSLATTAHASTGSFSRMIERQPLQGIDLKTVLHAMGMTSGSLSRLSDGDLEDLEFELVVRKKEHNRIQPLPNELIEGVISDGLDRAAELETAGTKRRGDAVVAKFATEVDVSGAYYDLNSVRNALWSALGEWTNQGLI